MPVRVAQNLLRDWMTPVEQEEAVLLMSALGRILSRDVVAPIDVPAHDNSAMDGYAFDGASLQARDAPHADGAPATREFVVVGQAFAGHPWRESVPPGHCVRIMTGALIPPGTDTVIPHEYALPATAAPGAVASSVGARVVLRVANFRRGANRRLAGEDLARGTVVLPAGRILRASDLGLLASLGFAQISVRRRLRVAYFSTGDELRPVGQPLEAGCVHDSNRYTLHAMLLRLGVEPIDLGIVRDDPEALSAALRDAASRADAILSSGGVSAGDADFVRDVFAALGDVVFWKLAMRPGRPFAFGQLIVDNAGDPANAAPTARRIPFFGLPGNPVAVMAAFYHIVRDALLTLAGARVEPVPRVRASALAPIRKRRGRTEFARGRAQRTVTGDWQVALAGAQGSGVLSSMSEANCFLILEHEQGDLHAGDSLDIMFFEGLI
ncbi:molybdopterin molybdotransferase MoeA [Robbsia sp. Bb-Pol-6]|uniref:Molybdopterin molybdenumtransferase n=1 Tax=Robbsia betulipollinis TaxID=2981849 RepID=A0ABT3ZPU4_9BURK|nr:gephyrin-like molybdotransferase Glp [Robbsia betulipollinis]MCY0388571.1 molybdopterin molybdotransferase MoeA [Robbsia betulipollinis]